MSKVALLAALLALPLEAGAQRFRGEVGAEVSPVRRLELSVAERLLLGEGITATGRWQTVVAAHYTPWKFLSVGAGYRFTAQAAYGRTATSHRALVEAIGSARWRGFKLSYRLRGQSGFEEQVDGDLDVNPVLRNRVALRWRSPTAIDVGASGELFSDIGGDTTVALDRFRVEVGVAARLRPLVVSVAYRYQTPLYGESHAWHTGLLSVMWEWSAPRVRRGRDVQPAHTAEESLR